ncbi:MAG: amidohydrolase family protein [Tepidiformaceae bacterium]
MTPVIDIHCHDAPAPATAALIRDIIRPEDDAASFFSNAASLEQNRKLGREQYRLALTSVDERLARMDSSRVDIQAVSPSPQQFYWADATLGARLSRTQNEHVAELVSQNPARFVGLGSLPLQDPVAAVAEFTHLTAQLGLRGVQVSTYVAGRELGDNAFEPVWEAAEALGAVVFIHPLGFSHGERFREFYLNNSVAHPLESTLALSSLIFSGVLHRHPTLKLVVAHGGGYLPFHASRLDRAWKVRPECRVHIDRPPSDYLKQVYVDTVVYTPESVAQLVAMLGADHVLLGTDYPFDMGEEHPVDLVERTPGLTAAERELVCGGNAARLLGIAVQ